MQVARKQWTWLGPIRALLVALTIVDCLTLPYAVLRLFNGEYPIGMVMFGDLFPRGFPGYGSLPASPGEVQLMGHPTGTYQMLMFGLSQGLGLIVATLPMLGYAYHVTTVALQSDPFTLTMVRKLRNLGLVILVGGLACEVAAFVAGRALLKAVLAGDAVLREQAHLDVGRYPSLWWWLLPGLLVLAFAEVVKRGCQLRAELDGVI